MEKKKQEPFVLPAELKDKIEVVHGHIICFEYHGRKVDLRKASSEQLLKYAADKSCGVLQLKEKTVAKASSALLEDENNEKETGKKTGK